MFTCRSSEVPKKTDKFQTRKACFADFSPPEHPSLSVLCTFDPPGKTYQPTPSGQMVDVGFFTLYIAVVGPMLGVLPNFTVGTGATFASEIRLDDWPWGQLQELAPFGRT